MRRRLLLVAALPAVAALAGAGLALAPARESAPSGPAEDPLLRSGAVRYAAYLRAEATSLADARRSGDALAVRLHEGRLAPAGGRVPGRVDAVAAVRSASRLLS